MITCFPLLPRGAVFLQKALMGDVTVPELICTVGHISDIRTRAVVAQLALYLAKQLCTCDLGWCMGLSSVSVFPLSVV